MIDKQTCIAEQSETILDHHSKVLNCSIQSGICPSALKLARVTPVHKSGPASDPNNFRPISVLPIISKLLERYMYSVNAIPTFIYVHRSIGFWYSPGFDLGSCIFFLFINDLPLSLESRSGLFADDATFSASTTT